MINLITDLISFTQPTNLDRESLSVIESIAKIKKVVNECITQFNNLENKTNEDYQNFLNQITNYKNEVIKIINDIKNDNISFKNEFREIIKSLENFNVTLEIIKKQSEYIQDLAKQNQDAIDKGTIATKDEINEIKRKSEVFINVKYFLCDDGKLVQGDGVHDDTTGIKKGLEYCKNNNYSLFFPKGIFLVSETIYVDDIELMGFSTRTTTIKINTNTTLIKIIRGSIKNIRLSTSNECDYKNHSLIGIVIGDENNNNCEVEINNLYFEKSFYYGIYSNVELDNTIISKIKGFVGMGKGYIYLDTKSNYAASACVKIKNCHLYNSDALYGIYFKRGDNCKIENNVVNNFEKNIVLIEHRNIICHNNHTEHRNNYKRFSEGLNVSVGDFVIPTKTKSNGFVYKVITGGTINGVENWTDDINTPMGKTYRYGDVVLEQSKYNISLQLEDIKTGSIGGTFDNSCVGIFLGPSSCGSIKIENVSYLGECDKIIKNGVTGVGLSLDISNCELNGNFDFNNTSQYNHHSYIVKNTLIMNNSMNDVGKNKTKVYSWNQNESSINIKTVTEDYTVNFETDDIIYVDTSNASNRVIITIPTTPSNYGKCVTIIKSTNDGNYVRINPTQYLGNKDLLKKFDSITIKKLPPTKYMCVIGSYFNN